jgi:large repetitive protein
LTSAQYARDVNETKNMGSISSAARTPDQTVLSWFWNSSTAPYLWNNVAASLINRTDHDDSWQSGHENRDFDDDLRHRRPNTTLQNARLFALLNVAIADALIGCWDAKYTYVFWRPVTAIPEAAADGNPATTAAGGDRP